MTLKLCKFISTCTCSSSATWETNLVVKDFFCFMLIHISHDIKYQFLKKIYDVINKVYTFKFENLTIFIAFPLPSMETAFPPCPLPCPYGHNTMEYLYLNLFLGSWFRTCSHCTNDSGTRESWKPSKSFCVSVTAVNCIR